MSCDSLDYFNDPGYSRKEIDQKKGKTRLFPGALPIAPFLILTKGELVLAQQADRFADFRFPAAVACPQRHFFCLQSLPVHSLRLLEHILLDQGKARRFRKRLTTDSQLHRRRPIAAVQKTGNLIFPQDSLRFIRS
jgi:hypothetical protein